jgi:hypothetical protein
VRTITEYITADTIMPPFFRYPRFLLKMDLSQTAKLLYSLLLDRSELSQKNGWQDNEGRTYIVYPVSEIAEMLDKGSTAIKAALNELDAAGLLYRCGDQKRKYLGTSAYSRGSCSILSGYVDGTVYLWKTVRSCLLLCGDPKAGMSGAGSADPCRDRNSRNRQYYR